MPSTDDWGGFPAELIVVAVPVALWVAALVCAGIAIYRAPRPIGFRLITDKLVRYLIIFPLGLQGLWAFSGHVLLPEESASSIGWAPSPFQYEVGVANLGLGLASFYAAFSGFGARAATAIFAACFLAGAGVGHIMDILSGDNIAPGNAGPILFTDFLTPIVVLILLILSPQRPARVAAAHLAVAAEPSLAARIEVALERAAAPRIEDELETARQTMREALKTGPAAEILPPTQRPALDRSRKGKGEPRKSPPDPLPK